MTSFKIKCAELVIEIKCELETTKKRCEKYVVNSEKSDIVVAPEAKHFEAVRRLCPQSKAETEFSAVLCALHEALLASGRNACVMHSAVVAVDGIGYAFSAPSGVGKTTQVNLWKKHFGKRCVIVNGDKPIISTDGKRFFASGSPWCGKEGCSENITVPLGGICFIERAKTPSIRRLCASEIIDRLFYQLSVPSHNATLSEKCLKLADMLIRLTPVYLFECNVSDESVITAYEEMSK